MIQLLVGDVRETLLAWPGKVQCAVTSPPYWLCRAYGDSAREIGHESHPGDYVDNLAQVAALLWDKLAEDGIFWLNLGDVYTGAGYSNHRGVGAITKAQGGRQHHVPSGRIGLPEKTLVGLPWKVALRLQHQGWLIRQEVIWEKVAATPDTCKDRASRTHEHVFMLVKRESYFYDKAGERFKGSVWKIRPASGRGKHTAVMPLDLARHCVAVSTRPGDVVLDPFAGYGTTGMAALELGRGFLGCELYPQLTRAASERLATEMGRQDAKLVGPLTQEETS